MSAGKKTPHATSAKTGRHLIHTNCIHRHGQWLGFLCTCSVRASRESYLSVVHKCATVTHDIIWCEYPRQTDTQTATPSALWQDS
mmetsp:Transcript_40204/g.100639  ORF Transcript_40204/g.100639 Transcript_40204/m.100639 type:complete len:85 (-) Transcript_40204:180-434(-)